MIIFSACSQENVSVQEGKYYLGNSDTYIKVSNFNAEAENVDNTEGFIGTCELQFFNYDFSNLDSLYNVDTSKQFSDSSCVFNFGESDKKYYLYADVDDSYAADEDGNRITDGSTALNFPLEYNPDDNSITITSLEEKFILK